MPKITLKRVQLTRTAMTAEYKDSRGKKYLCRQGDDVFVSGLELLPEGDLPADLPPNISQGVLYVWKNGTAVPVNVLTELSRIVL